MYTARPVTGIVEGYEVFEPSEESSRRMNEIIQNYEQRLLERTDNHLGYPYNLNFEVDALQKLQKYSINNLGDPWVVSIILLPSSSLSLYFSFFYFSSLTFLLFYFRNQIMVFIVVNLKLVY